MTLSEGIYKVLQQAGEPLNYREIARRGVEAGFLSSDTANLEGVINARLSAEVRSRGSQFVRVGRGRYALVAWGGPTAPASDAEHPASDSAAVLSDGGGTSPGDDGNWDPGRLLAELRALRGTEALHAADLRRARPAFYRALIREFKSLSLAVRAADRSTPPDVGFEIPVREHWPPAELMATVRRLPAGVSFSWLRTAHPSFYGAVTERYGSLSRARKLAEEALGGTDFDPAGATTSARGAAGVPPAGGLPFFTLRTFKRREREVGEALALHAKNRGHTGMQILTSPSLEQYVFVQAPSSQELYEWTRGIPAVVKIVGETAHDEIQRFLHGSPAPTEVREGDKVEILAGTHRGRLGMVRRIYAPGERPWAAGTAVGGNLPEGADVEAEFRAYYSGGASPVPGVAEEDAPSTEETIEVELPGADGQPPVRLKRSEVRPSD